MARFAPRKASAGSRIWSTSTACATSRTTCALARPAAGPCSRAMTKPLVVTVPHQLGRAEARRRIEEGLGQLTDQFAQIGKVKTTWVGDGLDYSVETMGQSVYGRIDVLEEAVRIEVVLPGFLSLIAGSLKGRLQKQGQILLDDKTKVRT